MTATDASGAEQGADPIVFTVTRTASTREPARRQPRLERHGDFGTDYTVTATGGTLSANGLHADARRRRRRARRSRSTPVDDTAVEPSETVALTLGCRHRLHRRLAGERDRHDRRQRRRAGDRRRRVRRRRERSSANPIVFTVSRVGQPRRATSSSASRGAAPRPTAPTTRSRSPAARSRRTACSSRSTSGVTQRDDHGHPGRRHDRRGDGDGDAVRGRRDRVRTRLADGRAPARSSTTTARRRSRSWRPTPSGAEQGSDPISFTITRTGNLWSNVVVNLGWSGTATLGADYAVSATGGTLSANGTTLTLAPRRDFGHGHGHAGRRRRRRPDRDA